MSASNARRSRRFALPWRRPSGGTLAKEAVLVTAVLIVLLPSVFVVLTALKTQADYSLDKIGLPPDAHARERRGGHARRAFRHLVLQ